MTCCFPVPKIVDKKCSSLQFWTELIQMDWIELVPTVMDLIELVLMAMDWTELVPTTMDWIELVLTAMDWIELVPTAMDWTELVLTAMDWIELVQMEMGAELDWTVELVWTEKGWSELD